MIYLFVLLATATMDPASGRVAVQTLGYYATAAECQLALMAADKRVDGNYVRLRCLPIPGTEPVSRSSPVA